MLLASFEQVPLIFLNESRRDRFTQTLVSPHDIMVLGWRKNKKANKVAATEPLEVVLPTKGIDLNSVIAIDDSGFFDVEAEFRDDGDIEDSSSERHVQFTTRSESIIPPSNFAPSKPPLEVKETEREPSESPAESNIVEDRTAPDVLIEQKLEEQKPEEQKPEEQKSEEHKPEEPKAEDQKHEDVVEDGADNDDDDSEDDDSEYRRYVRRRRRAKERRRWIKAEMRRKEKRRRARYALGDFDSDSDDDLSMYSETSLSWESNCGPDMRCCGMAD